MSRLLLAALFGLIALAGCQQQPKGPPPLPLVGQASVDAARAACTKAGGTYTESGGARGLVCVHRTRDAGKLCTKASDCEGECLARSGTCAPIKPLLGCQAILDNFGRAMTQCVN